MTFLYLCKALRQEAGYSGSGPETTVDQTGVYKKVVDWVVRAYKDVQNEESRWSFLWAEGQFNTVVGQKNYSLADVGVSNLSEHDTDSFFVQRPSATNKFPLSYLNFQEFRELSIVETTSNPNFFTVLPNKTIRFESAPTSIETIEFEYWRTPFVFSDDTDEPAFDSQHHEIILYKALMYYAADEESANVYADAKANYDAILRKLKDRELIANFVSTASLA